MLKKTFILLSLSFFSVKAQDRNDHLIKCSNSAGENIQWSVNSHELDSMTHYQTFQNLEEITKSNNDYSCHFSLEENSLIEASNSDAYPEFQLESSMSPEEEKAFYEMVYSKIYAYATSLKYDDIKNVSLKSIAKKMIINAAVIAALYGVYKYVPKESLGWNFIKGHPYAIFSLITSVSAYFYGGKYTGDLQFWLKSFWEISQNTTQASSKGSVPSAN